MFRKILALITMSVAVCSLCVVCGCSGTSSDGESHIYDNAKVEDVMSGDGSQKVGEYSLIEAPESEITDEVIVDWYLNYVDQNDFNWCMILYSDNEPYGVYSSGGYVDKGVTFALDADDEYYVESSDGATTYVIDDDGTIIQK